MVGSRRRPAREGRRTSKVAAALMTGSSDRPRAGAGGKVDNSDAPNKVCLLAGQSRRLDPIVNPGPWLERGLRGQAFRPRAFTRRRLQSVASSSQEAIHE